MTLAVRPKLEFVRPPFTEAHVTIIDGEMRSGKSCTATARIVDAYFKDCARVYCEAVLRIKCEVKSFDRVSHVAKIRYNGGLKLVRIPQDYKLWSPMKIFCNFHLYGIPYIFLPSFQTAATWLKQGKIINAWFVLDEAYVGLNARSSMASLGKEFASTYQQFAKMQLDVIIITPMAKQIDWIARTIPTERIHCEYNGKTSMITLTIRKKGVQGERKVDYDSRQYRKYYKTNERIVE